MPSVVLCATYTIDCVCPVLGRDADGFYTPVNRVAHGPFTRFLTARVVNVPSEVATISVLSQSKKTVLKKTTFKNGLKTNFTTRFHE